MEAQKEKLKRQAQEIAQLQNSNLQEKNGFQRARSNLESENFSLKERLAEFERKFGNTALPPVPENSEMPSEEGVAPNLEEGEGEAAAEEEGANEEMPATEEEETTTTEPEKETESSFAESEADLDEARQNLVLAIRDMEALRDTDLANRYKELSTSLKANSLARINFSSGKADLQTAEAEKIVQLAKIANPESEFLVAGFADMSGTKAGNATLSSARAKVAANFLGARVGYEKVSAIYLGQTARFGNKSKNRVVEIWELKSSE